MKTLTVETADGRLRGQVRDSYLYFGGVPYARPPVGALRFAAPRPAEPWSGVRDALSPGASSPQLAVGRLGPISQLSRLARGPMSEDCLTLNIATPSVDSEKRPVMVWLHGGAFVLGAGSTFLYNPETLVTTGNTVVVSINYRLGALGFLNLSSLDSGPSASSNLGIRDQIAALEWVRANIHTFGGDPDNVTVFGESAGAMSIGALLAAAPDLFRRAILQSGACANVSTRAESSYVAERLLHSLGVKADDLDSLRAQPVSRILQAQRSVLLGDSSKVGRLPWQPGVDGDLLPKQPLAMLEDGRARRIEVVVGTNLDEWKLFTSASIALRAMGFKELERRTRRLLDRNGRTDLSAREGAALYRRITEQRRSRQTAYEAWAACRSDEFFRVPAIELAETLSKTGSRCFMYRFDYPIPAFRNALGACHAAEVPLVFGTHTSRWLKPLYLGSKKAEELSKRLQEAWLSFARTGTPSDAEVPAWPSYDPETRNPRSTRILAHAAAEPTLADPEAEAREFWKRS